MTWLVAGADRVDAGKTTFALGFVAFLDGVGFKPRAGNDYWFDHDDYLTAIADGRLYGKDAARLARASRGDRTPESINPVHRLWRPAPEGDGFIGRSNRQFVLDRVGEDYVLNAEAAIPASARTTLPLDDARTVSDVDALNDAIRRRHLPRLEALAEVVRTTDRAVVESYGDIARPLEDFEVRRVAVVDPGRVRVYDGDRYTDACEVATGRPVDGRRETRVGVVVDILDPLETVSLEALPNEIRHQPDRIAHQYAEVYKTLR